MNAARSRSMVTGRSWKVSTSGIPRAVRHLGHGRFDAIQLAIAYTKSLADLQRARHVEIRRQHEQRPGGQVDRAHGAVVIEHCEREDCLALLVDDHVSAVADFGYK